MTRKSKDKATTAIPEKSIADGGENPTSLFVIKYCYPCDYFNMIDNIINKYKRDISREKKNDKCISIFRNFMLR